MQDSAKYGELEDIEKHRAGPVGQVAREVGSNGPTRKGRTPFTNEDDRILMKWVLQGEKAGISVKGNELFKQLEEKVVPSQSFSLPMLIETCRITVIHSSRGETAG